MAAREEPARGNAWCGRAEFADPTDILRILRGEAKERRAGCW
jgi:hypothetical protein